MISMMMCFFTKTRLLLLLFFFFICLEGFFYALESRWLGDVYKSQSSMVTAVAPVILTTIFRPNLAGVILSFSASRHKVG